VDGDWSRTPRVPLRRGRDLQEIEVSQNTVTRVRKLSIGGEVISLTRPFGEEVSALVSTNHRLMMETITRIERHSIAAIPQRDKEEGIVGIELPYIQYRADDLRQGANQFALVALVTRFQHWVRLYFAELTNKGAASISLSKCLATLTIEFGNGPAPDSYFLELETVRDSIIHADSRAEWMGGKTFRSVPSSFRDGSLEWVRVSEAQLEEAIQKSIKQINWYDQQIALRN
jgi:hypothetical protein